MFIGNVRGSSLAKVLLLGLALGCSGKDRLSQRPRQRDAAPAETTIAQSRYECHWVSRGDASTTQQAQADAGQEGVSLEFLLTSCQQPANRAFCVQLRDNLLRQFPLPQRADAGTPRERPQRGSFPCDCPPPCPPHPTPPREEPSDNPFQSPYQ